MEPFVGMCERFRVVIVGAGVSGIAAAARLIGAGFTKDDILILEASDRIGGRVNTVSFDGCTVELGAQWVHGENGNIIYETVKRLDLDLLDNSSSDFADVICVLSDKTVVNKNLSTKLYAMCEHIRDQISDEKSSTSGSYADYFVKRYNELCDNGEMQNIPADVRVGFLEWIHQFYNSIEGSDSWQETSLSSLVHYGECEGNPLIKWKQGGYKNVIEVISKNYGVDKSAVTDRVCFKKEVIRICWNELRSTERNKYSDKSSVVTLQCADGSVYSADCAIVTVSLGVLKQNYSTLFEPQLPMSKVNVIKGLSIGTVNKMFIKFPYKWWPENCPGFSLLWTKHDLENTDFIQGDNNWIKDIFGFYIVDDAGNLLCGWVVGKSARIMEEQSDDCVLDACYKLLNKFLGSYYNIPRPEGILRSKWQSEPYVRGSYSFRSLNTDVLKVSHAQLGEPLINDCGDKVVFFAGEATHPCFFSTVHGAIESGYKQAEQVASVLLQNPRSKL